MNINKDIEAGEVKKKGGRPLKAPSHLYDAKITINLKKQEKLKLEKIAENAGIPLATMLRSVILKLIKS